MERHGRLGLLVAVAVLAAVASGCGGGGKPGDDAAHIGELKGKSLGVASLDGMPSLELRYLLHSAGGLKASTQGGDVTFVEAPGDSLPEMLDKGSVYAAVLPSQVAFGLLDKSSYRVLDHVSRDVGDIAGTPVLSTVLLTYRDEANSNPDALAEAAQILRESVAYFRANQKAVLRSIVSQQGLDKVYVDWQSKRQRVVFGDSSQQVQKGLIDIWRAAVSLGDITASPALTEALFNPERAPRGAGPGRERTTISIAVLDDATRRGALYAIEQGLVRSQHVDLDITYLSMSGLSEAAGAREYDVVEASPMLVPTARGNRLDLVVLSGGVQDLDSTLLFVRAAQGQ
jgi:hypothetical protein